MMQQLKVVVTEDNNQFFKNYQKDFAAYGIQTVACEKNGQALLNKTLAVRPDIILADVFMPNLDILGVKSRLEQSKIEKQPLIMAMSNFDNQRLEKQLLDCGISYYFLMPFDHRAMAERILQISGCRYQKKEKLKADTASLDTGLEIAATEILHKVGIPPNIRGFYYLREAIMLCVINPKISEAITGVLYPTVAGKFSTTAMRVERAMRHAIEVACDRGNIEVLNEYFSFALQGDRGKPTNSEFVALISDSLRLKFKTVYEH